MEKATGSTATSHAASRPRRMQGPTASTVFVLPLGSSSWTRTRIARFPQCCRAGDTSIRRRSNHGNLGITRKINSNQATVDRNPHRLSAPPLPCLSVLSLVKFLSARHTRANHGALWSRANAPCSGRNRKIGSHCDASSRRSAAAVGFCGNGAVKGVSHVARLHRPTKRWPDPCLAYQMNRLRQSCIECLSTQWRRRGRAPRYGFAGSLRRELEE
jgi:hypothetical protein